MAEKLHTLVFSLILSYVLHLMYIECLPTDKVNDPEKNYRDDPKYFQKSIRMPNAVSKRSDALLCHAVKLDDQEAYILKYEPHASKETAHHMMVYGCGHPGSSEAYWSCGEMDDKSDESVCGDGQREIVYAWAMDADSKELPTGVGFRVGGNTKIKYLVIQLHYKDPFTEGQTDNSGVTLHMTFTRQQQQAGFYVLGNFGYVPPLTNRFHLDSACYYHGKTIRPIGYRTHSHNLGYVTSGYRIRNGTWTEIGRMSPQLPETFYDISNPGTEIRDGDILAARCTMNSDRGFPTNMGATNKDEMCNFYILYATDEIDNLGVQYCFRDAQMFKWEKYLNNIPEDSGTATGLPPFKMNDPYALPSKKIMEKSLMK